MQEVASRPIRGRLKRGFDPKRVKSLVRAIAALVLLTLAAGCGPRVEQLEAKQEGNVFIVRGRVKGSVGSVQVSGWGADDYVVAEREPGSGSFEARVPLYLLSSGKLTLRVQAKETEHMPTAMAESQLEVEVPAHAEVGIVDCEGEDAPPATTRSRFGGRKSSSGAPPSSTRSTASLAHWSTAGWR